MCMKMDLIKIQFDVAIYAHKNLVFWFVKKSINTQKKFLPIDKI